MAKGSNKGERAEDRESVMLRLPPKLSAWYGEASEGQGKSRNQMMTAWLEALPEVLESGYGKDWEGFDWHSAVALLGEALLGQVLSLGLGSDRLKEVWAEHLVEQRDMLRRWNEEQSRKARKRGAK